MDTQSNVQDKIHFPRGMKALYNVNKSKWYAQKAATEGMLNIVVM